MREWSNARAATRCAKSSRQGHARPRSSCRTTTSAISIISLHSPGARWRTSACSDLARARSACCAISNREGDRSRSRCARDCSRRSGSMSAAMERRRSRCRSWRRCASVMHGRTGAHLREGAAAAIHDAAIVCLSARRRVAAVVLAAGGSARLGISKQLIEFRGEPLVRRAAGFAGDAGAAPVDSRRRRGRGGYGPRTQRAGVRIDGAERAMARWAGIVARDRHSRGCSGWMRKRMEC